MIQKRINIGLYAVETLWCSFTWFRYERYICKFNNKVFFIDEVNHIILPLQLKR